MVKKVILIFLGICVLAVGGLTAYVSTVDWNTYRQEIADKFFEVTGKKIEFSGPISVQILPEPALNAKNVKIINPSNSSEVLATIDNLDTKVSLRSLLKGAPDIRSLYLIGAEIWINENDKGEINWKNGARSLTEDALNIRLQSLSVQNALLHYENAVSGLKFDLSQLNADIQAETLAGPYRLDGNFVKNQDHFGVAVSLGSFSGLADIPVNFAITHPKSESFLRFDGVYMPNEQAYKGDFSGGSKQTADFANVLSDVKVLDEQYNVPLQFSVGVETDSEQIKLSSFIIKYDNFIEGSGSVTIPLLAAAGQKRTIDVKYQLVNLDLRPLLSVLKAKYRKFAENGSIYQPDFDLNIMADISSERVVLNDEKEGAWESVSLKGSWMDNTLSLDEFYAACTGNTVLTMSGSLVEEKKAPQYFLKASVDSKDFLAFLNSLGIYAKSYVQGSYRNALVSFNLSGNNSAVSANDIKFAMDKMNISGVAGVTFRPNGNVYELQLAADSLNLDNYLPKNETAQTFMDNIREDIRHLSFLKWLNVHAGLRADKMTFRGTQISNAVLAATAADSSLKIENFSAEGALESKIKLNALLSHLGSLDLNIDEINFNFQSQKMKEVNERLQLPWPNWKIFGTGTFQAVGKYQGNLHAGMLDVKISADENRLNYTGEVKQEEKFGFNGQIDVKTINFGELVNNLGGNIRNNANTRSAFSCAGNINGIVDDWKFDNASCTLGLANYQGEIVFAQDKNNYRITAKVTGDDFNLENVVEVQTNTNMPAMARTQENYFLPRPDLNKNVFVFDMYRKLILDIDLTTTKAVYQDKVFNNLKLHVLNSGSVLQLNDISAILNGVGISGNLQISYEKSPQMKGHLKADNIDLKGTGGKTYQFLQGKMSVVSDFNMPASSLEEFVTNYTGMLRFEASDVSISGLDFAQIQNSLTGRKYSKGLFQKIRDNLQSGETDFPVISGGVTAERGNLTYDTVTMQNNMANINVSGSTNLSEWKMNNTFAVTMTNLPEIPPFSFTLSGMINKPALDINIEDIVNKYDAHWEEVEAAKQAEKAARAKELNAKMEAAQHEVSAISEYGNRIIPIMEGYLSKSDDEVQMAWYRSMLSRLNEINRQVDNMQGKAHLAEFTENDVNQINNDCAALQTELSAMEKDGISHHREDVAARYQRISAEGASVYDKSSALMQQYRQLLQDKFDVLLSIGGSQKMTESRVLKDYQTQIGELNDNIRMQVDTFVRQSGEADGIMNNTSALENLTESLKKELKELTDKYTAMEDVYKKTDDELQQIINAQQKIYDEQQALQKQKEEAIAAENAKNLLNDTKSPVEESPIIKSGEPKQPVVEVPKNNIDKGAPELEVTISPETENRPTLRKITEDTIDKGASGTIKKSYEKENAGTIVKENKNKLLKEVEGAVQKPSGRIIVK
ncbi:MAG: AsmA family protein [Pseudomonadota bacterium]|nr:AsmA family protein [Pseudomonadota bacterium]